MRGERTAAESPGASLELKDGEIAELGGVRIEIEIVIDCAVAADCPSPVEHVERFHRPGSNLMPERLGPPVRAREDAFTQDEEARAPGQAEREDWERGPIEADPTCLHDRQLAGLGD